MSARDDSPKDARADAGAEEVFFGYKLVSAPEKRRLVSGQFDPIARRYDLADAEATSGDRCSSTVRRFFKITGLMACNRIIQVL